VLLLLDLVAIGNQHVRFADEMVNMVTAIYSLTLATTILATVLIITRILQVGQVAAISRYGRVMELVIESSALYSLSVIFILPYWVLGGDIVKGYPLKFVQAINSAMVVSSMPRKMIL
jgi:hypothetical protein